MKNAPELAAIRFAEPDDIRFIFSTWLRGYLFGNPRLSRRVKHGHYYATYHPAIESIMSRPGTLVRVACLKDQPDVILGYSVQEGDTLHWVFVKAAWRRLGVARTLIQEPVRAYTHQTKFAECIKPKHWEYSPIHI